MSMYCVQFDHYDSMVIHYEREEGSAEIPRIPETPEDESQVYFWATRQSTEFNKTYRPFYFLATYAPLKRNQQSEGGEQWIDRGVIKGENILKE
ncbi:hypothetical protein RRG08_030649 [Elysia crispata]|uniref:Uncharacterized protein n=1 Tax=Elysia crispata TaxID=231223 RepID=A0AAE0YQP0_9GAST|nr:hypothetical protein RRG08_030649 [Elysia crispata]